jgi:hypothetical protein
MIAWTLHVASATDNKTISKYIRQNSSAELQTVPNLKNKTRHSFNNAGMQQSPYIGYLRVK